MPPPDTLVGSLVRAAESERGVRFLDRHERASTFSYAEILERARRVAAGLQVEGVRAGERVALVLPTSPAFLEAFYGVLLAGAVPVPLYPPVRLGRLDEYHERTAHMLRAAGARLVVSDRRVRRLLGEATARAGAPLGCLAVESLPTTPGDAQDVDADALAFVQFSSGTTTAPKPVALTHRQVLANVRAILDAITRAHPEQDGWTHAGVSWLPLYHDMGLIGCVLTAVDHPGDLTLIPPELFVARPAIWLRAISRWGGTVSPAPNFAYALCADRVSDEELAGVDLSSWRVAMNGAEPVTPGVLRRFVERFAAHGLRPEALTPVYGLAEASLAVTFSPLQRAFESETFARAALTDGAVETAATGVELVNLGRPLPGFELRIVSDQGVDLAEGRVGRVWVRGPSVMREYLGRPEETTAVLRDDWLDTGDTGFFHHGDLFLYGRAKDLIVVRGRNWAPQDIEQVADEVRGVRIGCSAAIGVVGEDGEELVLLVEKGREENGELAGDVRRRVLARVGLPARVVVLEPGTLPRTSSGKVRRRDAHDQWLAGALRPPEPVNVVTLARAMASSFWKLRRAG